MGYDLGVLITNIVCVVPTSFVVLSLFNMNKSNLRICLGIQLHITSIHNYSNRYWNLLSFSSSLNLTCAKVVCFLEAFDQVVCVCLYAFDQVACVRLITYLL